MIMVKGTHYKASVENEFEKVTCHISELHNDMVCENQERPNTPHICEHFETVSKHNTAGNPVNIVNQLEMLAQENTTLKTSLKTLDDTIVLLKTDQQYIQEV